MLKRAMRPLWRPILVASTALGMVVTPAVAKHRKLDPITAARNDPHSSAYLNREIARGGHTWVLGSKTRHRKPPRIALPSVNDPTTDLTVQDTQSETTIIDLGSGSLVAAFNDSGSYPGASPGQFTGYAYSPNNGITWNDAGHLPPNPRGDAGDPNLAFDQSTGEVYLSTLAFSAAPNAPIQVFKSVDHGHTFAPAVDAAAAGTSTDADKEWLAVDNFAGAGQHNVYACYTEFGVSPASVRVTRSLDHGVTFGSPVVISNTSQSQGCFLTVSPNHQLNVYYFRGAGTSNDIFTRHSSDLGVTFGVESLVAHLHTTSVNGDVALLGGARTNSFPHAVTLSAPATPYQYVIYNDLTPATPATKSDIYLVLSTDGGITWSPPRLVNDDTNGDQFMPTLVATAGNRLMIGYYSRSHDPLNLAFHRRSRLGTVNPNGTVTFDPLSFQLGPDNPIVIAQDPVVVASYMGDYDQIAASTAFSSVWGDNRSADAFHANQPDVHFAQIAASQPASDLSVTVAAPSSVNLGQNVTMTVTVTATGGTANDVYLSLRPVSGLVIQSINSAGGGCQTPTGRFSGCSLGSIPAGSSKSIQVVATAAYAAGTRTFVFTGSTSSRDTNNANNTASATVSVGAGGAAGSSYSSGNIAAAIPDAVGSVPGVTAIPIAVPDQGTPVRVTARVRLNHPFDSDLRLTLISPTGKSAILSQLRGGAGDNFGSGNTDCSGTSTIFDDLAATPISAGSAPFTGLFAPEQPLSQVFADPMDGTWKLKIEDLAAGNTGTVYCARLDITHVP